MRKLEFSSQFKRDCKKISLLEEDTITVLYLLLHDETLPPQYRDHLLIGDWQGYRECHIKPDLLLIYRQTDDGVLRLARLGSHSALFA